MTLPAQGLRGVTRRLPPGPADLHRTAGIEKATRRLLPEPAEPPPRR
jgi:hypothetical protein